MNSNREIRTYVHTHVFHMDLCLWCVWRACNGWDRLVHTPMYVLLCIVSLQMRRLRTQMMSWKHWRQWLTVSSVCIVRISACLCNILYVCYRCVHVCMCTMMWGSSMVYLKAPLGMAVCSEWCYGAFSHFLGSLKHGTYIWKWNALMSAIVGETLNFYAY